jgi:hypothetical protein
MLCKHRDLRLRHVTDEGAHRFVDAIADLELADLAGQVSLVLSPDHRHRRVAGHAVFPVTRVAEFRLGDDVLRARRGGRGERQYPRDRV